MRGDREADEGNRERERREEGEREKARGSNLPFSSLKRRVYQDEESQEGIKGV